MTAEIASNLIAAQQDYPPDEWRVTRQLVRMIGTAKTWQDIVEASDALFHVQVFAQQMRAENDHHMRAHQNGQMAQQQN